MLQQFHSSLGSVSQNNEPGYIISDHKQILERIQRGSIAWMV